jgi:undecaprenyl diphosphate synthase
LLQNKDEQLVAAEIEKVSEIVKTTGMKHIAIIMDGNRRWAKERNLPTLVGHKKGVESLKNVVKACHNFGVKYLTVYAFSTENWNRDKAEVDYLMELFALTIKSEFKELHESDVVLKFVGDLSRLNSKLQKIFADAEEKTRYNKGVNLQIAVNYGARDEIVNAVKSIVKLGYKSEEITEDLVSENLYTSGIPNPDLLIRTGGEMRISNYLLWQIAYSEFLVTSKFWPEFDENALSEAIVEFKHRQRRYGK